jgi:hypothetical protein
MQAPLQMTPARAFGKMNAIREGPCSITDSLDLCRADPELVKQIGVKQFAKFHDRAVLALLFGEAARGRRLEAQNCNMLVAKYATAPTLHLLCLLPTSGPPKAPGACGSTRTQCVVRVLCVSCPRLCRQCGCCACR